jgi:hypothetical protein
MKTINCEAEILPNGHLVLPHNILKQIKIKPNIRNKRKIIILNEEHRPKRLSRFCGKWKDERDADEIIAEIRNARQANIRSDKINL